MNLHPSPAVLRLSVVSHDQTDWTRQFLTDLQAYEPGLEVVFTHNTNNPAPQWPSDWSIQSIHNTQPKGFAANHNQALKGSRSLFVCVANPDIRLTASPFPALLAAFDDPQVGLVVPQVLSPNGTVEDSVRRFPTPWRVLRKLLGDQGRVVTDPQHPQTVPWAAGMFMVFRQEAFEAIGGFDEGFHLYYEDVDICARLWAAGWKVVHQPNSQVVHHAQRASRRQGRYFRWHLSSMLRFFIKHLGHIGRLEHLAKKNTV
jgi:N-acetylglucosaminyl-diphospho-decaprenol L-rhamnosyltransferase